MEGTMTTWSTFEHPYHDVRVSANEDGQAWLEFGEDLRSRMGASEDWDSLDDIPVDGEVIRAAGRLFKVGTMDTSDPPILHPTVDQPDAGLWWDADSDTAGD
jgi:hypothetical protein